MSKSFAIVARVTAAAAIVMACASGTAYADNCGNGSVQPGEVCDNGGANSTQAVGCCAAGCATYVTAGTTCRPDAGTCDSGPELCDGSTGGCPADVGFAPSSTVCRAGNGICDSAENCTGTSAECPSDTLAAPGTICRAAVGGCDIAEECAAGACPTDLKRSNGAVCRPDSGDCDPGAEFCDGTNTACPADSASPQGTLCRAAATVCDAAEFCDGTNSTCPNDAKTTSLCRPAAGDCDIEEFCDGTNNACPSNTKSTDVCRPAVNEVCDVAESCNGDDDNCPDDELVDCEDNDSLDCTVATCDEFEGCIITDQCVEICRGPGFWATHSGWEKGENIGDLVLDEVGSLEVCGQIIDGTTNLGSLDSSLEGLCVRTQGVKQRSLYRVLVTTAFNCAISEGADCEQITGHFVDVSWEECNALCAGDDVGEDGPTLQECKDQFACFNGGGTIIDGECIKGTCANSEENCSDDEDCGEEEECVPFEDSCASQPLCSEDSEAAANICPKPGPASSPKTCRDARKNWCTIDSCF